MPDFISTILSSPYNPVNIRQRSTRTKALLALAAVSILWGTTWLASKEGVKHMPALQLAGIRQTLGGLAYVMYFLGKGNVSWPKGREWMTIIILSFLNFMLSNGLSTWGVKYISAGLGSIIAAIFPLWLVIIGLFSNQQKLPRKAVFGLMIGFGGICIIFFEHLYDFLDSRFTLGIILSVAATWTWAFGTIYTKEHAKKFNPYFGIGLQMIISGIGLFAISDIAGLSVPMAAIPWKAWASIGYLVLFGSIIAFMAYLYALQHLPTEQTSLYAYVNPIVAVLLGTIVFGERMTVFIAVGGIVTLLGVYFVNSAIRKMK